MRSEGPQLEPLLRHLAECPPEFLELAAPGTQDGADLAAIVCDVLRPLCRDAPPESAAASLEAIRSRSPAVRRLVSLTCRLLADEWFQLRPELVPAMWRLLTSEAWERRAALVRPDRFITDADRREEFVRFCLNQLGFRLQGETEPAAADRLTTLDSVERDRVLRATAKAERRAREVREAMVRKQALESASRYGE